MVKKRFKRKIVLMVMIVMILIVFMVLIILIIMILIILIIMMLNLLIKIFHYLIKNCKDVLFVKKIIHSSMESVNKGSDIAKKCQTINVSNVTVVIIY